LPRDASWSRARTGLNISMTGGSTAWLPAIRSSARVLKAVVERSGIDALLIEDVIVGCVTQAGEQSFHIGRNAALASKLPERFPR
jgi:acetyl-CoA C-acetyltransferase